MSIDTLLAFIRQPESGGNYDIVWGGIKPEDRPERRIGKKLTALTIGQVLDWQDSIDVKYRSEAAGAYQFMEDTLRGLYHEAGMTLGTRFSERNQDLLATALLRRRGLTSYLAGNMSAEQFANNLAREWASLPVVTGPKEGRSYYAGDGLNKAHVTIDAFLVAVRACKLDDQPVSLPDAPAAPTGWAAVFAAILRLFRKSP